MEAKYSVMIRVGEARKIKRRVFETAADAEAYFNELCQRRTDYPAVAVLTERILVIKRYRLDKKWRGDRVITNDDLLE